MKTVNKYIITLFAWMAVLSIHAQNVVTLSSVRGTPGEEVTVAVSIDNTDAVSAVQLIIPLDANLSLVAGSAAVTDRASGHAVTAGVKDNVLTLMLYSISMATINPGGGEVASFRLRLGNQPGDIPLTVSKTLLTTADMQTAEATAVGGTVTIACAKAAYGSTTFDYGHIPIWQIYTMMLPVTNVGNETLTITSLAFLDATFSSSQTLPLDIEPGETVNIPIDYAPVERGEVRTELYVVCNSISKLNTITLTADPFAVNELHVQEASGVCDEEVTIRLTMNNMDAITGFQFEFNLPDALQYVDGSFALSSRKADHALLTTCTNSVLRAICYSSSNSTFAGYSGEVATFKVRLNGQYGATLEPSKAILTAMIKGVITDVASDTYGAYITISSPSISVQTAIDMGAVPVTEDCTYDLNVANYGNAPLTISRVVFDNPVIAVDQSFPLVIPVGASQTLTVFYNSIEEVPFEAMMQIYCNDPDHRLVNITVSGSRFAPNYLNMSAEDVMKTDGQTVAVTLDNYDPVNSLQFDLTIPTTGTGSKRKAVYQPADVAYTTVGRADGMTVLLRQIDTATIRYFCYFLDGRTMERGDAPILNLHFSPADGLETGLCMFNVSNITLGTEGLTDKYAGTDFTCSFNVIDRLIGDVNRDGGITIADVTALVDIILGKDSTEPYTYDHEAADVNQDSSITIADVTALVDLILGR